MTRISPRTIWINRSGFTLIELLVVVALIAMMSFFAVPRISSYFRVSLNAVTRELATTVKETYNSTVITGKVNRLVYDLKGNAYWAEIGPATALLDTEETKKRNERKKFFLNPDNPPPNPFSMNKLVTRKKVALPRGVVFEDIVTQQSKEPITSQNLGVAFTHFFPQGLIERTMIHLTDQSQHHITLVISPIIGRTELYERYVTAAEVFGK